MAARSIRIATRRWCARFNAATPRAPKLGIVPVASGAWPATSRSTFASWEPSFPAVTTAIVLARKFAASTTNVATSVCRTATAFPDKFARRPRVLSRKSSTRRGCCLSRQPTRAATPALADSPARTIQIASRRSCVAPASALWSARKTSTVWKGTLVSIRAASRAPSHRVTGERPAARARARAEKRAQREERAQPAARAATATPEARAARRRRASRSPRTAASFRTAAARRSTAECAPATRLAAVVVWPTCAAWARAHRAPAPLRARIAGLCPTAAVGC